MKLYFVRHGHNEASPSTIPNPETGELDEPLDELGVEQAEAIALELRDIHFDAVITSALKRTRQTAEIINHFHNLPIVINNDWREREVGGYVEYEIWKTLFDFDTNIAPVRGETLRDFFTRAYAAFDKLKAEYADKTVLIAGHGGIHLALYTYANNFPLSGKLRVDPLHNCELRIYEL